MVETLTGPEQRSNAVSTDGSPRARNWTLAVACMGVGLVVASMTALNTALGDAVPAELDRPRVHRGSRVHGGFVRATTPPPE